MKQKFPMFSFVMVDKTMPDFMSHFKSGFLGIVYGTHSQLYGGENVKSYGLYIVENNKIVNSSAWYDESQLTLSGYQDRALAEQMVEDWNFRRAV